MNKFKLAMFLFSLIVLAGVIWFSNPFAIADKLATSDYKFIIVSFVISIIAISLGVLKWKILLNKVGYLELFPIQLLGYTISNFSPGKAAEPAKAIVLKMRSNVPVSTSLPSIIWERIMDVVILLMLSLLALNGISLNSEFFWPIVVSIALFILVVIVAFMILFNEKFGRRLFGMLKRLPVLNRLSENFADLFYKNRIDTSLLIKAFLTTLVSWVVIGFILYTSLLAFGYSIISPVILSGVVALSVIIGIASSLPGGVGTTEIVMIFLLTVLGVDHASAAAATITFRLATIWFVNILGGISFVYLSRKFNLKNLLE
jgi:uncharacterized protein (TIRG00374 family)